MLHETPRESRLHPPPEDVSGLAENRGTVGAHASAEGRFALRELDLRGDELSGKPGVGGIAEAELESLVAAPRVELSVLRDEHRRVRSAADLHHKRGKGETSITRPSCDLKDDLTGSKWSAWSSFPSDPCATERAFRLRFGRFPTSRARRRRPAPA